MIKKRALWVGVSCLGLAVASPAGAQDGPSEASAERRASASEEIIVTARKRSENLQDVPAAITALGGEMLASIGADGIDDFVRLSPGLNLGDTGFYGFKNFRIRGVTTTTGAATVQAPVAMYFDEVATVDPYVPHATADFYLTDIERVEVLRGPQGTLFGSGSLSGAVRILTKKPQLVVYAGSIEATVETVADGETGGTLEGMINIPIGERFAVRAVAYDRDAPGWIDNILTGEEDQNAGFSRGARLAARADLTDTFSVTASFAYQYDDFENNGRTFIDGAGDPREWSVLTPDARKNQSSLGSLVAEWDLGWASLTSATSYLQLKAKPRGGGDYFSALIGLPGTPMWQDLISNNDSFFQEVRLASQTDGPLSYIVGLYYSDRNGDLTGQFHNPVLEGLTGLDNLLDSELDSNIKEIALFGEVAYKLRDDLELAVGARVFRNEFESAQSSAGLLIGGGSSFQASDKSEEDISPRITLTWEPTEDLTLYGQAAKGYRIGQTNSSIDAVLGTVPRTFDPDQLWNYEIGAKTSFLDGRGRASAAAFYIDWQDVQVQLSGPSQPYTSNAGAARIIGLETELSLVITEHLEIQNSLALTNAELAEDVPDLQQPSGVTGAFEGDPLPGSPDFTSSTALQYTRELAHGASFYIRGDHQYVSDSRNSFSEAGSHEMGDYHVFNASAGYDLANGIGFRLFAKNIADDDGVTNVLFGNAFGLQPQAIRLQPRTIGVSVRKTF